MTDQNNMNQGYPQQDYKQVYQQNYQQSYPQQQYQQGNPAQGAQSQTYLQNYQQGYQQQYQQMNQGYVAQSYQQPTGGGMPPKGNKPKTGLIVGIVIAAIAIVVGIVLAIFKDEIFGSEDKKTTEEKTTENDVLTPDDWNPDLTTEIAVEDEGGFENYEDLLPSFWEAFEYCDEEGFNQCYYMPNAESAQAAKSNYENAVAKDASVQVHYTEMTAEYDMYGEMGLVEETIEGRDVLQVKEYHCEVPMTQEVNGVTYEIIDIYEGTIYQLDNYQWYLSVMTEVDVQIVSSSDDGTDTPATTETQELGETKPMGSAECGYVDVPTDWVEFMEEGGIDGTVASYQMCSPDMQTIVTMCVYDNIDPYSAASNIYGSLDAEGDTINLVTAMANIGKYEAYQVYAEYSDLFLVTYCFTADDGKTHYVAIEFPINQAGSAEVQNIESSYRLTE